MLLSQRSLLSERNPSRGGLVLMLAAVAAVAMPASAQFPVAGQVVDATGRSLPFVVVTSRTRNGFLSTWTDLNGRFAFPGRPHRRGDTIKLGSWGYRSRIIRFVDAANDTVLTLDSMSVAEATGWGIGLPVDLRAELFAPDGSPVRSPALLHAGEEYRLRVTSRGRDGCTRRGPSALSIEGSRATVAVADFLRNRECRTSVTQHERVIELFFDRPGPGEIRIVGRYGDVVVPISVVNR